ncbi:MAG: hypothetical protein OXB88_10400, partial [Bacteriovoracales bacterium]|nr:hypothetical protein [Bacteriovoracales bacterium]
LLASCSVKHDSLDIPLGLDSDGDTVSDYLEIKEGRNRFVADLPDLRVRFLQNYTIAINYIKDGKEGVFTIDTKAARGDPHFRYRVGDRTAKHLAFREAARVGRYATHHTGEFSEQDLSWIRYPTLSPAFSLKALGEFQRVLGDDFSSIQNIRVTLENSVKLKGNGLFSSIANLEVNLRYYDREKESYVHLGTQKIERHFSEGVNETFRVVLENVPLNLIRDSYFWRGEFIISEIKDYEIPSLKTTYRKLLNGVREQTLAVLYNTPLESTVYRIALGDKGKRNFHDILKIAFGNQFTIENDRLTQITQFTSNLGDYTYLKELKDFDKRGRWFVLTTPIKKHYLDHRFKKGDKIAVSYITGDVLASQKKDVIQSYGGHSTKDGIIELGDVSSESKAHIQMRAAKFGGERPVIWEETLRGDQCGTDCVSDRFIKCYLKFSKFEEFSKSFKSGDSLEEILSSIKIIVGEKEFPLSDERISLHQNDLFLDLRPKLSSLIEEKESLQKYRLAIKMLPLSKSVFNGVLLENWEGRRKDICVNIALNATVVHQLPISVNSIKFDEWKFLVRPELTPLGEDRIYKQHFSTKISSLIINLFN